MSRAAIPLLAKAGVQAYHIGYNGACRVPQVWPLQSAVVWGDVQREIAGVWYDVQWEIAGVWDDARWEIAVLWGDVQCEIAGVWDDAQCEKEVGSDLAFEFVSLSTPQPRDGARPRSWRCTRTTEIVIQGFANSFNLTDPCAHFATTHTHTHTPTITCHVQVPGMFVWKHPETGTQLLTMIEGNYGEVCCVLLVRVWLSMVCPWVTGRGCGGTEPRMHGWCTGTFMQAPGSTSALVFQYTSDNGGVPTPATVISFWAQLRTQYAHVA